MVSLTSFVSQLLIAWFCCLLPAFQTFKALTHRPVLEPLLERWCKYWTIIGVIFAYQNTLEPFVSWFPFYWELKSLFLIFLALPQTQGSTYIYDSFLKPYLVENEDMIDSTIESIQSNAFGFLRERFQVLWQFVYRTVTQASASQAQTTASGQPGQPASQAPPLSFANVMNVVGTYGPSFMQAFKAKTSSATPDSTPVSATASGVDVSATSARTPTKVEDDDSSAPSFPEPQLSN